MIYNKLKIALWILFAFVTMISCSEDVDLGANSSELVQNFEDGLTAQNPRDGGNNGGPGGGNDGGSGGGDQAPDEISFLDNDILVQWTDLFLELDRYADGMRPNSTARALAYINLAAYETANPGMRSLTSNSGKIPNFRLNNNNFNTRDIDWELALNACYADVMDHFLINVPDNRKDAIKALEDSLQDELSNGLEDRIIKNSIEWGDAVARQVIEYAQTDTEAEQQIQEPQPLSYEPPTGEGYWTYSAEQERALFPYWESVRTFVVSPEETTTRTPIRYSENPNSSYYRQMRDVYEQNNAARAEDGEALWIAEFWSDDVTGITFSPPARQFSIANQLVVEHDMNLRDALLLYVKLGFSLNDAAVSTWKYKYEHMVMRPNVFIHEFMDASFQTNLYRLVPWPNPTFPGYPSGHSCFASAAAGVFNNFFGREANFTDRSHEGRTEFRGAARTFRTFDDMAIENGYSRIPLGVHVEMDCTEGLRLGYEISNDINRYSLTRRPL